ncbi:MAG: hypothetical protein J7501_05805 [Bdellovibrio sp.]|nr:hypothetical protein [Bdellovibrio sp.]
MKKYFGAKELGCIALIMLLATMVQIWGSQKSLDIRLYYTAADAKSFFAELSPAETAAYIRHELFDLAFIGTYSLLFFFWLQRLFPQKKLFVALGFVPGLLDFIETTSILGVLLQGLQEPPLWLGTVTFLKWFGSICVLVLLIFGGLRRAKN